MANCFPFTKSRSIVCEDATVALSWPSEMVTPSPMNFSNAEDNSLNETYSTAVDDDETQYLSVLESSHDNTLEDIHNLTLSNQKLITQENDLNLGVGNESNFNLSESSDQQVVVFNIEGSDEIFGIQMAEDEDGNIHRYQFQFRKTNDGQLEAMPETIQLLSNEEGDLTAVENQETIVELSENQIIETPVFLQDALEQTDENCHTHLILSEEPNNLENVTDETNEYNSEDLKIIAKKNPAIFVKMENQKHYKEEAEEEDEEEEEREGDEIYKDGLEVEYYEESLDIKPGYEIESIKQELYDQSQCFNEGQESSDTELENHEETVLENFEEEYASEAESYDAGEIHHEIEEANYPNFETQNVKEMYEEDTDSQGNPNATQYEQLFIEEGTLDHLNYEQEGDHVENANVLIVEKDAGTNDSEIEDYEIVEGLPVTAEGEISEDTSSTIYQETEVLYSEPEIAVEKFFKKDKSLPKTTNILKQPTNVNKTNEAKKKTILYYMVPNTDQKENVNSLSLNTGNPRSLLKNNLDINKINEEQLKKIQREKLLERRYARSKEAIQAKMFNNFINKTTIAHAPVRQCRLPRKQEIKPVDARRNEEIIVQEVMVSSKGFVESISDRLKNLDKLEVTSIVELSDSDEDYDPKNGTKKKKKHKKTKHTNIVTSDSDVSIIEILNSEEDEKEENSKNNMTTVKKCRGRPKKDSGDSLKRSRRRSSKSGSGDESSPQKRSRTEESSEVESDNGKKEINCPHCPKTFPNQNSLSTHIQHHSLENSLRHNKNNLVEYKHKCTDCQQTFINSILLKRHICYSKDLKQSHKCAVCFKVFKDVVIFNIHKKSHLKETLIKSTSTVTISPKKYTPRPSTSRFKMPTKPPHNYKCKECSKICSTLSILAIHEQSHKKFICASCNISFPSKILLDSHVISKCVKKSPKDKRVSFKIKRSFISSPRRSSIKGKINTPTKATCPIRKSTIPFTKVGNKSLNIGLNKSSSISSSKLVNNTNLNKTVNPGFNSNSNLRPNSSTFIEISSDPLLNTSNVNDKSINPGLKTSSMRRTLPVDTKCDSCTMKFSSLTALFKHKVKSHGLHTPDKRVLEPKRKSLHKPLNLHGGIPANKNLNKAFQEIRKILAQVEMDPSESSNTVEKNDVSHLPKKIVSKTNQSEQ